MPSKNALFYRAVLQFTNFAGRPGARHCRHYQRKVRNSPSFQRTIDRGQYVIELHAWLSPESASFATFIYEKAGERFLRHFTGSDENEVIRQARMWCEKNN
jgi:hypothetical protein